MISNEILIGLMPFTSKIAFLLSNITEKYLGVPVYYHNPHTLGEEIYTILIKFITLLGINLNVIQATLDGGYYFGVIISIIYFLVSYLIPNFFFDDLYKIFDFLGVNSNVLVGFLFGITIVILLDVLVIKLKKYYKKKLEKDGKLF